MKLDRIPALSVDPGKRARREYGDDKTWESFKEDIRKTDGIMMPIAVIQKEQLDPVTLKEMGETDEKQPYLLIAGGRRLKAMTEMREELGPVPAQIYDVEKDAFEIREMELIENLQRKQLDWQEELDAKDELHRLKVEKHGEKIASTPDAPGHSMSDTAKELGESKATTSRDLKLKKIMSENPELGEILSQAKTKSEAWKMLGNLEKIHTTSEVAKEIERKHTNSPEQSQKKKLIESYKVRDAFEVIKEFPKNVMNFMEIDPPWVMEYTENRMTNDNSDMYDDWTPEEFEENMRSIYEEAYRVLEPNSWMMVWFAPDPWFDQIHEWAYEAGFEGKKVPFIWAKQKGQSRQPKYNMGSSYEMAAIFRKGRPILMEPGHANYIKMNRVPIHRKKHPNDKPVELYQQILKIFTSGNQRVFSPFLGGGNILLAASNLGIDALGCDLDQRYRDSFVLKVNESRPGKYKTFEEQHDTGTD